MVKDVRCLALVLLRGKERVGEGLWPHWLCRSAHLVERVTDLMAA